MRLYTLLKLLTLKKENKTSKVQPGPGPLLTMLNINITDAQ